MTAARPSSARAARSARCGMWAASSGVRPSSSGSGSSAHPSGTSTTYFTAMHRTRALVESLGRYPPLAMSPKRVAIGALIAFAVVNAGVADARAASVEQSVKLVRVAPLLGATATAVRGGDPTLYVANQGGVVRAIRRGRVVAGDVLDLTK